ncbi:MAG: hypothetical protein QM723_27565 [Myxococcaceae bacterium]
MASRGSARYAAAGANDQFARRAPGLAKLGESIALALPMFPAKLTGTSCFEHERKLEQTRWSTLTATLSFRLREIQLALEKLSDIWAGGVELEALLIGVEDLLKRAARPA